MTKKSELLVNVVIANRPKLLSGLTQNGAEVGCSSECIGTHGRMTSGEKAESMLSVSIKWNVVSPYLPITVWKVSREGR